MRSHATESGFSLIEVLVTVVIVGITFVVFVGGMETSIIASDHHRKHAVAQASIRNFAEAVKAVSFSTDCPTLVAKYQAAYSPPPPTRLSSAAGKANAQSHVASGVTPATRNTRLLAFYAVATGTNLTSPLGMTTKWVATSGSTAAANKVTVGFHEQALTASGATGSRTSSSSPNLGDSVAQLVSVQSATPSAGPPVYRGVFIKGTPAGGASQLTIQTPVTPSPTQVGDEMFAQVALRGVGATVAPPPGWTLVNAMTQGSSVKSLIYEKTAREAATSTGPTHTWTFNAVTEAAGGIVSYGGASKSYVATVTGVSQLDYAGAPIACSTAAAPNIAAQIVSLRFVSLDQRGVEVIDVVKRCHEKRAPTSPCEDSP